MYSAVPGEMAGVPVRRVALGVFYEYEYDAHRDDGTSYTARMLVWRHAPVV